jgi:hypothetical protein
MSCKGNRGMYDHGLAGQRAELKELKATSAAVLMYFAVAFTPVFIHIYFH